VTTFVTGRVLGPATAFVMPPEELCDEIRRRAPESEQRFHSVGQIVEGTMEIASHVVRHDSALPLSPVGHPLDAFAYRVIDEVP